MWSKKLPAWLPALDNRIRTAALAAAALLLLDLALYGASVAPAAARLEAANASYAALRKRHAEAVLYQKQKKAFAGIIAGIPAQKDMPLLVKDLVQTARGLNLSVASVKYDIASRSVGELSQLAFSFPAEGRYPDLKRFIYEVETSDRIVGIQELKIDSDKSRVRLDMKLVTYLKGQ